MNAHIFRANDIRGLAHSELTPQLVSAIGAAFARMLPAKKHPRVFVGKDARTHSETLAHSFLAGLASVPCEVVYGGDCTSPISYFAASPAGGGFDATVMVTGSHNPPEYNGLKMTLGGRSLSPDQITTLRLGCGSAVTGTPMVPRVDTSVLVRYREYLCSLFPTLQGMRIGIDCANTTMALVAPEVLGCLGAEVHALFTEIDGTFPNHHPDPTIAENLTDLMDLVRQQRLDVGFAYDGDGDRVGVVLPHPDDGVRILWSDQLLLLFARDMARRYPGRPVTVVSEVKCSQLMYDGINRLPGFRAIMGKAGHSFIKSRMLDTGALLGGEMSGHIFFADEYLGFDDALYASCRFACLLKQGVDIWDELREFEQVCSTAELRLESDDQRKVQIVDAVATYLRDPAVRSASGIQDIIDVDGLRICFGAGAWALLRASNTQPALVMRVEAATPAELERYQCFVEQLIERVSPRVAEA
ncbi:phosphoglucomutase/phosphomannomutase alpha/beta/alpha domain I [Desulfurispirillum indicum S5]|uniref:Phosphoglucomutase/phosphomannomutase alpha/beta/alpha domain I n=1 Tax=Desulfurispirillum indicum (strain ATCC BAA-1389 / DSM 22839 / S5) TaxID=653733 RepID=E6W3Q5_DESIS|nr:phosphomannomutase/phosphoglucomutase [Desulfurispirillum indicum]ADU66936.1 phosphoglucomutase/phosphomannomutase alpha/beta/alpha domain I [Desulfurispirillum indicum S5]